MHQIGEYAYAHRVQTFLNYSVPRDPYSLSRCEEKNIRAIVLTGEASHAAFAKMGVMALAAVGTDEVVIATGIDPADVVAHGAAVYARLVLKNKDKDSTSNCGYELSTPVVETEHVGAMRYIYNG
jgi:hypothetical protein